MRDDADYRALQEDVGLLRDLVRQPGWDVYVRLAHEGMAADKRAVLNGTPKDIDEYRKKTGWLTGVHHALDLPGSVIKMLDDEQRRRVDHDLPLT